MPLKNLEWPLNTSNTSSGLKKTKLFSHCKWPSLDTPSGLLNTPGGLFDTPSGLSDPPSGLSDTLSGLSDTPSGLSDFKWSL